MLGTGDPGLEYDLPRARRASTPAASATIIGYDEPLAHQMQAAGDAIVIPSRFEPCGLTQLYGLRYGCVPIVRRTGGLADTVIDANLAALNAGAATGFQFTPSTPPPSPGPSAARPTSCATRRRGRRSSARG